jgi:hypothetical protein
MLKYFLLYSHNVCCIPVAYWGSIAGAHSIRIKIIHTYYYNVKYVIKVGYFNKYF